MKGDGDKWLIVGLFLGNLLFYLVGLGGISLFKGHNAETLEGSELHFGCVPIWGVILEHFIGDVLDVCAFWLGQTVNGDHYLVTDGHTLVKVGFVVSVGRLIRAVLWGEVVGDFFKFGDGGKAFAGVCSAVDSFIHGVVVDMGQFFVIDGAFTSGVFGIFAEYGNKFRV